MGGGIYWDACRETLASDRLFSLARENIPVVTGIIQQTNILRPVKSSPDGQQIPIRIALNSFFIASIGFFIDQLHGPISSMIIAGISIAAPYCEA